MNKSLEIFREVLNQEARALVQAADRVNLNQVEQWRELLIHLKATNGSLIFCGVGKSGHICQKMASTFSSLGLPSFFLHPVEALHGDLGRVTEQDVLVLLSKSGNTEELLKLLPYTRIPRERRVGILGAMSSPLAQQCALVFDASVEKEACLNDLAPTTSSTLALGIGDAMAVMYEHFIGLSKEGFARNHPSGRLGRSLTLRVHNLMIPKEQCAQVSPTATLKQALLAMTTFPVSLCAVVDTHGKLLGIVVEGDIRRVLVQGVQALEENVSTFMNHKPQTILSECMAMEALELMENRKRMRTVLPVVDDKNNFCGVIRHHELFGGL